MQPAYQGIDSVYKSKADNKDIRDLLERLVPQAKAQMVDFSKQFKGRTEQETCKKIFDYIRNNFTYLADGEEQIIKLPSALLKKKVGDCKSYSLFTSSILENLGIPYSFIYTSYNSNPIPGHVYVMTENGCIIDAVYGIFNQEKKPIYKYKKNMNVRYMDYYADLDALLEIYQPDMPVNLVAHSMGGNVACTYAGIRPQRVARLVSLEGFGMGRTAPDQAAGRYQQWLDELRAPPRFNSYTSFDAVAARLKKNNRRLTDEQAHFLAQHWAKQTGPAEVTLRSDPKHKFVNPVLTRLEELLACWRQVTAPVLWVAGDETNGRGWRTDSVQQLAERKAAFRDFREIKLQDCGHMMHHDQPVKLAAIIEGFLARH